ncbi:type II toxin-antitoxin system RelE/ParE family toxin [soil metagenome]
MTYSVIWTAYASVQLTIVYDFAAQLSESFADRLLDDIDARVQQLLKFPFSGGIEDSFSAFSNEYRYVVCGYCKVIYRVEDTAVVIINVFDTRQDPQKMKMG